MKFGEKARRARVMWLVLLSYVACSVTVLWHLWVDPQRRMFADNYQDHVFFEWVLTHAARVFTHGDNPFFTDQLNAPLGVNLMANTSILGLALPLAPITLLFGAGTTLVLIDTIALAGTAFAWYFILSRHVVTSRVAAYIGALFCGFAPPMISQSTGHPNIAGQFMIPLVVWFVLRLRQPGSTLKRGIALGAVVLYQSFINEEILFLTSVALLVFLVAYLHPREYLPSIRAVLPGIGVGAAFAGVFLVYPLYHQFFGPQAYHGLPDFVHGFSTDLASFKEFSRRSILAPEDLSTIDKMGGPTEENTFFGWPLMGLLLAVTVAMWRQRMARALVIGAAVFGVLSLGTTIRYNGHNTSHHGPWNWVHQLPLFDSVVPTRLGVIMVPFLGVLLALVVDQYVMGNTPLAAALRDGAAGASGEARETVHAVESHAMAAGVRPTSGGTMTAEEHEEDPGRTSLATADELDLPDDPEISDKSLAPVGANPDIPPTGAEGPRNDAEGPRNGDSDVPRAARWLWAAALLIALVPLIPTPQPANDRSPIPVFFSSGAWQTTIPKNSTVVALPLGWWEGLDAMRWSVETNIEFKVAGGYFLVPDVNDPDHKATFSAATRPTMEIINTASSSGEVQPVTGEQRAQAREDLKFWHADFLILPEQHGNADAIRQTAEELFGPGQHIADVWVWKVTV